MSVGLPGEAGRVSLYVRIAISLRSRIEMGEWQPDQQMPTIDQLAEQYDVSRITVRQALNLLSDDGLIVSTRGRGTFIAQGGNRQAKGGELRAAINDRFEMAEGETIEILGREPVTLVPIKFQPAEKTFDKYTQIRKLHSHRGEPFALIESIVATEVYLQFPPEADEHAKLIKLIKDHSRVRIAQSRQEMTIAHADHSTSRSLLCAVTAPLVKVRSWRRDKRGRLIFAVVTLYRGDRFIYDIVENEQDRRSPSTMVIPNRPIKDS